MMLPLSQAISAYLAYRRSLGWAMTNEAEILQRFCRALRPEMPVDAITPAQVFSFLAGNGPLTRSWHCKHQALGGFYRFALARNYIAASPLPVQCPPRPPCRAPHIWTREELRRLLAATDSFPNRKNTVPRGCLRALLLLLYGAGLRLSEGLGLSLADTDLVAGVLTIRHTKFHKTRLVPVGPDLKEALLRYREKRYPADSPAAPLFLNREGVTPDRKQVERAFRRLRVHAGIEGADGPSPPRIHDLRHAFAVHRLVSWYEQGADVQRCLPQLSTYLGHVDIASTQWYLTMTAELLSEAGSRFEQYAGEATDDA